MKRFLLLFVALGLLATASHAELRWGPTLGAGLTSLKFKQPELFQQGREVGPQVGVDVEIMFPGIGFGFRTGLVYAAQGAKLHLGERPLWALQGYGTERLWLHNVNLPLHLEFKWTRMGVLEDKVAPFVYGGPMFTFLVAHSGIKAVDYTGGAVALVAGGGVEIMRRWQVSASYMWGMTYTCKMAKLQDDSAQERSWNFRVTYFF